MEKSLGFENIHSDLKNAYSDIQDKYRDIKKLEASVRIVNELFNDMADLVFVQGEMLDSIEANLDTAKDYLDKGLVSMTEAKDLHGLARKKLCCLICMILVIVVVFFGGYKMFT